MGSSMHVVGFKPPGEKWQKMRDAWRACVSAGVQMPDEVAGYFGYNDPDDAGVEVSESDLGKYGAVREWENNMREGFEVDVTKLPKDVTVIRFYNSY